MKTRHKKKQNAKDIIGKLQRKAELLWKEFCILRDGRRCMVEVYFPDRRIHTSVYQVDHCFSRQNKSIFTDVCNGTVICSGCNMSKKYDTWVKIAVEEIVKQREGEFTFERLREQALNQKPFLEWKNISWLEIHVKTLEEMVEEIAKIRS